MVVFQIAMVIYPPVMTNIAMENHYLKSQITHKLSIFPSHVKLLEGNIAIEHGPFIVDVPTKDGDFSYSRACLPEGIPYVSIICWLVVWNISYFSIDWE